MNAADLVDPEIKPMLELIPFEHVDAETLSMLRGPTPPCKPSDVVHRTDVTVPCEPSVSLRVTRANSASGLKPCLYAIHGGGYVMGNYDMFDQEFERWCPMLDIVTVSVGYRLAPETPYPGALDDCYAGLHWTFEHADELGIDVNRIGIFGVSAGGGLAAALSLLARDRGELSLAFQLLDSPMLDDRQQTASSQLQGLPVWSRQSNSFGWRSYLGELAGRNDVPSYAAPARATELEGLPPTFVSVGTVDGFRDEAIDYAVRLNQAGVPCELHVYPGAPHGYQLAPGSRVARQSLRDTEDWLARRLSTGDVS
jgi:acetyl esterase/lipase